MRPFALTLAVCAALALALAAPAAAGGWTLEDYLQSKPKSDWAGYGVGTMVHTRTSMEMTMPQMPAPQNNVSEEKKTLMEITDAGYVIKQEMLAGGQWIESTITEPLTENFTSEVTDAGTGTVTIGGQAYECAKKKVVWKKDGTVDETVVVWENAQHGVLKMEMSGDQEGTMTITEIGATFTIGDVSVTGRKLAMVVKNPQMGEMTGVGHMSMDVPENLVRMELTGGANGMQMKMVREVITFVKQ